MLELATQKDWEAVQRLSVQIHDLHAAWRPDIYVHADEPYPKETFQQDILERKVYVAKLQETVVGYVIVSVMIKDGPGTVSKKLMRLDSICVDESLRRHGIGTAIMADVRALAKAFGCKVLLLGVHPENNEAVAFYQKCGFRIRTINMDCTV